MAKRKRPKKSSELRQLLEDRSIVAPSALVAFCRDALAGARLDPPDHEPDPKLFEALTDLLVERRAGDQLNWLASLDSPRLAKTARAGLHRLRSRKVRVPERARSIRSLGTGIDPAAALPPSALTRYDADDQRLIYCVFEDGGELLLCQARTSARLGLIAFDGGEIGRKAYRRQLRVVEESYGAVEVSARHASWFIRDAIRRSEARGRALPVDYLRFSAPLPPAAKSEHPALAIDPEGDGEALLSLFQIHEMDTWSPATDELERLTLQQNEIATSRLMVDQAQRVVQADHALTRWLEAYFTEERRAVARLRLLDTADLLRHMARPVDAARARAAAEVFTSEGSIAQQPFVRRFAERLLDSGPWADDDATIPPPDDTPSGLILP